MTRLNSTYNWGQNLSEGNPELYRQLSDVYGDISRVTNNKTTKSPMQSNPVANADINKNFDIGDIWVNSSSNSAWILTSRTTPEAVTWTIIT